MLSEFYSDIFEKNPLEFYRGADGHIQIKDSGDSYIDKWEAEIAANLTPDLTEAFTPEEMSKYLRLRAKGRDSARLYNAMSDAQYKAKNKELLETKKFPSTFGDD